MQAIQAADNDLFSEEEISSLSETEKAIVQTTIVLVPERRRRTSGRSSRSSGSGTSHSTQPRSSTSLPRQDWPPPRDEPFNLPERYEVRVQSRSSSLRRVPRFAIPDPSPQPQPNAIRIIQEPISESPGHESQDEEVDEYDEELFTGPRIRDNGMQVREEVGRWPAQVLQRHQEQPDVDEGQPAEPDASERQSLERESISHRQPPRKEENGSSWPSDEEDASSNRENQWRRSPAPGKWQAMPPFTQSDLSERRKRRRSAKKSDDTS